MVSQFYQWLIVLIIHHYQTVNVTIFTYLFPFWEHDHILRMAFPLIIINLTIKQIVTDSDCISIPNNTLSSLKHNQV